MKKLTKKIIAREFLFLLTSIVLFFTLLLLWVFLEKTTDTKIITITEKIEQTTNKLPSNKIVLIESFRSELDTIVQKMTEDHESEENIQSVVNYFKDKYGIPEYALSAKFEKMISETQKKETDYKELMKIIKNYREDFNRNREKYDSNLAQLSKLKKELEAKKNSFFYKEIENNDLINLGVIIISFLFGFRYFFYATKWSLKQLKE